MDQGFTLQFSKLLTYIQQNSLGGETITVQPIAVDPCVRRALFKETRTNYISKERLQNVDSIKLSFVLDFAFQRWQRLSTPKMND